MLGFAPFNRPVARLFLGDGGSLPIGLVLGWLLLQLAGNGHLAAALLLPLYYLADATITLLRRMARGERITQAHRSHFYQIATTRGFSVMGVVRRGSSANVVLAWLAVVTVLFDFVVFDAIAIAARRRRGDVAAARHGAGPACEESSSPAPPASSAAPWWRRSRRRATRSVPRCAARTSAAPRFPPGVNHRPSRRPRGTH